MRRVAALLLPLVLVVLPSTGAGAAALSIHVDGNHLLDGTGDRIRLLGVNFSGAEYACAQGYGIFDAPHGAGAIAAMVKWRINAVRIPLNEDCWLGINGVKTRYSGSRYRNAIAGFVARLHSSGLYAILELHWNAPGTQRALGQKVMADHSHSPAFWHAVATRFRGDRAVLFDLYNEPHDISWRCWRDGCRVNGWRTAGMQELVDAVRSAGATQPVLLGGLGWANHLGGWLQFHPHDPEHQLVASLHLYNFTECVARDCWGRTVGRVAQRVPVVTGEVGEADCAHRFIDRYMAWADALGISYLGWTWNVWGCKAGPSLIKAVDGTPTPFGIGFRDHLRRLQDEPIRILEAPTE
jgi:hypothetical protein